MTITARTARSKGRAAENALAAFLQANGFPDAERSASKLEDRGDIAGVPGTAIQVKNFADPLRGLREGQAGVLRQAMGRRPVAVVRLPRVTDPALWWASYPFTFGAWPVDGPWVHEGTPRLPAKSSAAAVHGAIADRGWVLRGDWMVSTVDRLFGALR